VSLQKYDDYLSLIGADLVMADTNYRGAGYSVALLDTGVDYTRPELSGKVILGPDFGSGDGDPMDTVGHGTQVAGLMVSGSDSAPGIAPQAKVVALKITSDGATFASVQSIADALQWVIEHHDEYNIAAVNLSFATGNVAKGEGNAQLEPLYRQLSEQGVFIAAAAGNDYALYRQEGLSELAASEYVTAVGAVWDSNVGPQTWLNGGRDYSTGTDRIVSFSQRSAGLDLLAPGGDILTLCAGGCSGGTRVANGTSMASPIAAAAAVLVRQAAENAGVHLSSHALRDLLRTSADSVFDGDDENDNVPNTQRSYPRLNLAAAIRQATIAPASAQTGNFIPLYVTLAQQQLRQGLLSLQSPKTAWSRQTLQHFGTSTLFRAILKAQCTVQQRKQIDHLLKVSWRNVNRYWNGLKPTARSKLELTEETAGYRSEDFLGMNLLAQVFPDSCR
jgi:subtilisin family serine protease